jgi:hypothetical protein
MKLRIATLFLTLTLAANCFAAVPYIVVLGTAQDAGVPQMGCDTPFCRRAWADPGLAETVSSIALVDPRSGGRWIFDATPDLPEQFQYLKGVTGDPGNRLDGIFLTHAHIGHYTGLMYLGRESMNASAVRTYAMPRMKLMLEQNAPWSQLVSLKNVALTAIFDKTPVKLADDITVEPFLVPHRDEFSETVGFRITARGRKLDLYPRYRQMGKMARIAGRTRSGFGPPFDRRHVLRRRRDRPADERGASSVCRRNDEAARRTLKGRPGKGHFYPFQSQQPARAA